MERGQCGGPHGEGRSRTRASDGAKSWWEGQALGHLWGGAPGRGKVPEAPVWACHRKG